MTTAAEINIKCTVESTNESGKELKTMTFPLKVMWNSTDFFKIVTVSVEYSGSVSEYW